MPRHSSPRGGHARWRSSIARRATRDSRGRPPARCAPLPLARARPLTAPHAPSSRAPLACRDSRNPILPRHRPRLTRPPPHPSPSFSRAERRSGLVHLPAGPRRNPRVRPVLLHRPPHARRREPGPREPHARSRGVREQRDPSARRRRRRLRRGPPPRRAAPRHVFPSPDRGGLDARAGELPRPGRMDQGRAAVQARRPGGLGGLGGGERGTSAPAPAPAAAAAAARRESLPRDADARASSIESARSPRRRARPVEDASSRRDGAGGEASRRSIALFVVAAFGIGAAVGVRVGGRRRLLDPDRPRGRALGRARAHRARRGGLDVPRGVSRGRDQGVVGASRRGTDSASAGGAATREAGPDPGRMARPPGRPGAKRPRTSAGRAARRGRGDPGPRRVRPRAREPRGSPRRRLVLAGVRRDVEARAPGDARSLAVARPGRVRGGRPKGGARRREPSPTGRRETREGGARDVHHRRAKILRGGARRKPGRRRKPSRARPGGPARVVASEGSEDDDERSGGGGETNTRAVRYVRRAVRGVRRSARVGVGEGYPARERVESSEGEGKRKRPAAVRRRRVRARTLPGRRSGSGSGSLPPRSDRLVGGDDARLSRAGRDAGARGVRRAGPVAAARGGRTRGDVRQRAARRFRFRLGAPSERPLSQRGSEPRGSVLGRVLSARDAARVATDRDAAASRPRVVRSRGANAGSDSEGAGEFPEPVRAVQSPGADAGPGGVRRREPAPRHAQAKF